MNLCIDIGNTSIAYSIWNGKKFASIQRIPTGEHEIEIPNKCSLDDLKNALNKKGLC